MDILISDNPYDLLWKKRGSKYLTTDEVQNLHNALIEDSKKPKQTKMKYMLFGAPAAEDTTPDIIEEDVNKDQTTFTGLPFLIGTEEEESVGSSIPYICSEDLVFIIASESGNGYL